MRAIPTVAALAAAFALPAALQAVTLDAPWRGYRAGESAYPGNSTSMERDPTALTTADFDGDGRLDVAVSNYEYASPGGGTDGMSGFVLLRNLGDGTYAPGVHTTVSNAGCWDIVAADFDRDGDPDVAVSVSDYAWTGQTVRVYFNDGSGTFPSFVSRAVGSGPVGLAAGDFNGDGSPDLAVACHSFGQPNGTVSVLLGNGAGGFAAQVPYSVGPTPFRLETADLNGDGSLDLAVAHDAQQVSLLFNNGNGTFGAPVAYGGLFPQQGGQAYACVTLADTDHDGDPDVFYGNTRSHPVTSSGRIVHFRNDAGTLVRQADLLLTAGTAGPTALSSGDADADGWADLIGVHFSGRPGDGAWIVKNDGAGGFLPPTLVAAGQGTFDAVLCDTDGQGLPELVTADRFALMVTVHRNDGGQMRQLGSLYPTTYLSIRQDVGDVDGDGDLDVFTSCESTGGDGALLRNRGDGTFDPPVTYNHSTTYGRGVSRAKLRDLDGDGDLDLLYNDAHTDYFNGYNFYTAMNDGAGNFGPIVEWVIGTCGTGDVDAFDLDGDGDLDVVNLEELACGTGTGNRLFLSMNRGDATFDPPSIVSIDTQPHAVLGGDFNEDGNVDLVTAHWMPYGYRDTLNVHLGNGDGTLQEEAVFVVGKGSRWIVTDDFDGDGHADLATANSGDGDVGRETLTVLFGTGTGAFTARTDYYTAYSPDLLGVTGLAVGDLNDDGRPDLAMSTVAGGISTYLNDGAGGFALQPYMGLTWDPWSVMLEDLTGDGVLDVAALVSSGGALERWLAVLPGGGAAPTSVDDLPVTEAGATGPLHLSNVSPNPMGTSAWFTVQVPRPQQVKVTLHDVRGRAVRSVHEGPMAAGGAHRLELRPGSLPSGVYFLRAAGETFREARRVQVLR